LSTLKKSLSLTSLNLSGNDISDESVTLICEVLKSNARLTIVNLSDNIICNKGAKPLATTFESNPSLKSFDLRRNEIGDVGAKLLGHALKANTCLTSLKLEENPQLFHESILYLKVYPRLQNNIQNSKKNESNKFLESPKHKTTTKTGTCQNPNYTSSPNSISKNQYFKKYCVTPQLQK